MTTFFSYCIVADCQTADVPLFSFTALCFDNTVADLLHFVCRQIATVATPCVELPEHALS